MAQMAGSGFRHQTSADNHGQALSEIKQQFAVPHRKNVFAAVDDAVLVRDGNAGAVGRKPFRRFRSVNNDNGRIPVRFPR